MSYQFENSIYNIVVLGNTGVGKSSLLNMLAGNQNAFIVGDEGNSQTQLTSYDVYKFLGKQDGIKLRLVDTQGLSDTGGDKKDMQHIKNMVERIRELETIDLFLLCLDGMNPRFTAYVQSTISLFSDIFPDFLHHTVLVFNKWNIPQQERKATLKTNYRDLINKNFNHPNIPCFFIDSFYNLKMLRDNDDGTQTERELHPNIQARTHAEVSALITFLVTKNTKCNVTKIEPKPTQISKMNEEIKLAEDKLIQNAEEHRIEFEKLSKFHEEALQKSQEMHQTQLNSLNNQIEELKNRKDDNFWTSLVSALAVPVFGPIVTKIVGKI